MYYTGKQSKNKRDGQWRCIDCKKGRIKKKLPPPKKIDKSMFGPQLKIKLP